MTLEETKEEILWQLQNIPSWYNEYTNSWYNFSSQNDVIKNQSGFGKGWLKAHTWTQKEGLQSITSYKLWTENDSIYMGIDNFKFKYLTQTSSNGSLVFEVSGFGEVIFSYGQDK